MLVGIGESKIRPISTEAGICGQAFVGSGFSRDALVETLTKASRLKPLPTGFAYRLPLPLFPIPYSLFPIPYSRTIINDDAHRRHEHGRG